MNFVDKDGAINVYIPVHPWLIQTGNISLYHFKLKSFWVPSDGNQVQFLEIY